MALFGNNKMNKDLFQAIRDKHTLNVREALVSGADANAQDEDGVAALMYAVWAGNLDVIQILCDLQANVDVQDKDGMVPLMQAARQGNIDAIKILLEAGADMDATTKKGKTVLDYTPDELKEEVTEVLQQFREKREQEKQEAVIKQQQNTLMDAARNGEIDKISLLLQSGVDVNTQDEDGISVLMHAAENGHNDVVQFLIQANADVNARSNAGWTALTWASYYGYADVVETLCKVVDDVNAQDEDGKTALMWAVENGRTDAVKALLQADAKVDVKDNDNKTALDFVPKEWKTEMIKMLRPIEFDRMKADLIYGISQGNLDIVNDLLGKGADANSADKDGRTVLMQAVSVGNVEIVQALLSANATVDATTTATHQTALMMAASAGNAEIVQTLLNAKANPNIQNDTGRTALMFAAQEGYTDVVQALIQAKANVNMSDNEGRTALMYAVSQGHTEIVQSLLEAGVEIDAMDNGGKTALDFAPVAIKEQVTEMFRQFDKNKDRNTGGQGPEDTQGPGTNNVIDPDAISQQQIFFRNAAARGEIDNVRFMLHDGIDANAGDKRGRTALMKAAYFGHANVVEELANFNGKIEIDAQDYNGYTALMWAASQGHVDVVEALCKAGADVHKKDKQGYTVLNYIHPDAKEQIEKIIHQYDKKTAQSSLIDTLKGFETEKTAGEQQATVDASQKTDTKTSQVKSGTTYSINPDHDSTGSSHTVTQSDYVVTGPIITVTNPQAQPKKTIVPMEKDSGR